MRLHTIHLCGDEFVLDILGQAFVEGCLRPVDAKVPVAVTLVETEILLKYRAGNADLKRIVSVCSKVGMMQCNNGEPSSVLGR